MNNYDEIAKEAIKNITGFYPSIDAIAHNPQLEHIYQCAYEAAKLQAERFNDDLDASYIKYLEHKSEEELC